MNKPRSAVNPRRGWRALRAAAATLVTCGVVQADLLYEVQELSVLPTGSRSLAQGLNEAGWVVGGSDVNGAGYTRAVLWVDGVPHELTGEGISGARGAAVNDNGAVVGFTDSFGINAFRWHDGTLVELFHPLSCCSLALDINNDGTTVGTASLGGIGDNNAVFWVHGALVDLGFRGEAHAVNEAGQIVGERHFLDHQLAFLYEGGAVTNLATLGGRDGYARDINELGQVVGYADNDQEHTTAFVWQDGVTTSLGTLDDAPFSYAYAINDQGKIVGSSYNGPTPAAVLWLSDAAPINLNDHLVTDEDWLLTDALDINNAGQIVGVGQYNGAQRGFLLTPLSPPGDLDGDGDVDQADLGILLSCYGVSDCGDLDGDGDTDQADLGLLLAHFGDGA